jgi:hypothetical protein
MHCVMETPQFEKAAKAAGLSLDERTDIAKAISQNPLAGELMEGTGGARKVRFAAAGRGKRSGHRVITYFGGDDVPIFLLDLYAKGDRVNLSKAERNQLKSLLGGIADDYRASTKEKVRKLSEIA